MEKLKNDQVLYYWVKAYIAESKGMIDSATWYLQNSLKYLEHKSVNNKVHFYTRLAEFEERHQDSVQAKENYLKAYEYVLNNDDVLKEIEIGEILLTNYIPNDNEIFKNQNSAYQEFMKIKNADVIRELELNNILDQKNAEEHNNLFKKQRKSTIQIQFIFLIIVVIFIAIVLGSSFRWPKSWIRILSYVSLITLFELLLYIAVYGLHKYTNEEPIKVLGIKVLLIVLITPFHHRMEKFMVHFFSRYEINKVVKEKVLHVKQLISQVFSNSSNDEEE